MGYKRPFHGEESYEVGCKHPRQQGHLGHQSPLGGMTHCSSGPHEHFLGENSAVKSQHEGKIAREMVTEDLTEAEKELELNAPSGISSYLWVNGNSVDAESEAAVHLSFFPHFFELDHHVTALVQPHDIYSVLLDRPPRIPVSVGPDHQADVPEWAPNCFGKSSGFLDKSEHHISTTQCLGSCVLLDGDYDDMAKLEGTCVISVPEMESLACDSFVDGETRNYCHCLDRGSVRCVKQHVREAREKLRENLGQSIFEELGFCDMGEEVAEKWTEEEEQTFHEVVLSNAASQGKNFWDYLSAAFSSRTKKELVSYYFNVFMLRKRAEQNRFDPLNVDSDNDEWQVGELGITEEDNDHVVETLDQDAPAHNQENLEDDLQGIEEGETGTSKDDANCVYHRHKYVMGEEDDGDRDGIDDVSEANGGNFIGACSLGLDHAFQLSGNLSSTNGKDQDM